MITAFIAWAGGPEIAGVIASALALVVLVVLCMLWDDRRWRGL